MANFFFLSYFHKFIYSQIHLRVKGIALSSQGSTKARLTRGRRATGRGGVKGRRSASRRTFTWRATCRRAADRTTNLRIQADRTAPGWPKSRRRSARRRRGTRRRAGSLDFERFEKRLIERDLLLHLLSSRRILNFFKFFSRLSKLID